MISPFDYGPHLVTTDRLTKCEDFCAQFIWNQNYSSAVLGPDRPPMAAVAKDIMTLVNYFKDLGQEPGCKVSTLLKGFIRCNEIYCLEGQGDSWAARALLTDMFKIVIDVPEEVLEEIRKENVDEILEGLDANQCNPSPHTGGEKLAVATRWPEINYFPGGQILRLNELPLLDPSIISPYGSLQDIDARFILSGPFKIKLTRKFTQHLTLNEKKELLVYWEGKDPEGFIKQPFPGRGWGKYESSTLGTLILSSSSLICRQLNADTLAVEIWHSYSLLFTRNGKSRQIAKGLFQKEKVDVQFINPASFWELYTDFDRDSRKTKLVYLGEWDDSRPMYENFNYYRPHLALLQKEMYEWKPQRLRDLFTPGYKDRFWWYTTWGAITLGTISIITSIVQIVISGIMLK